MRNPFAKPMQSGREKRHARRQKLPLLPYLAAMAIGIWFAVYTLQLLFPFETWNPFERKVTVGEKVIHEWKYGGVNSAGDLLFFNNFNSVTIPMHQDRFDADGNYILIKGHTADTLTLESKDEYLIKYLFLPVGLVGVAGAFVSFLFLPFFKRNRRSARWRSSFHFSRSVPFKPVRRTRSIRSAYPARKSGSSRSKVLQWRLQIWKWRTRYRR